MDILNDIIAMQGGGAVRQVGSQLGLGEQQTASALSALVPALAAGLQHNVQSQGLGGVISALSAGSHERYLDDPATLGEPSAVDHGNGILGQLLGSKDASREVASRASAQTGISADVLKRMLPLAATLLMGAVSRRAGGQSAAGAGGLGGMLGSLLDGNHDGSMADDVAGALGKLLRKP